MQRTTFDASDGFLGAPPWNKSNAEKAAPSKLLTSDDLGEGGNIRTPHRVTTVTSFISRQPRTQQHCAKFYRPCGGFRARRPQQVQENQQEFYLNTLNRNLCITAHTTSLTTQWKTLKCSRRRLVVCCSVLSSPTGLVYCPSESLQTCVSCPCDSTNE